MTLQIFFRSKMNPILNSHKNTDFQREYNIILNYIKNDKAYIIK